MSQVTDTQGAYLSRNPEGQPGQVADASLLDVSSRVIENAAVGFGLAVGRGAADGSARLGGAGFEGITIIDKTLPASASPDAYAIGDIAGIARKGSIWVTVGADVDPSDTVYFVPATGVITSVATSNTEIPNATFETTATSGSLARVHLA